MSKRALILLVTVISTVYSQESILFPEIVISAPGLVPQKVGSDEYIMVQDTSKKIEITHIDSADKSQIGCFIRYFTSKLNYSYQVVEQGYSGTVWAGFNIDSKGFLINIRILIKVHPILDDMVLKILQECPQFNPKEMDPTMSYALPVRFRIMD